MDKKMGANGLNLACYQIFWIGQQNVHDGPYLNVTKISKKGVKRAH
jgi:hypothetical protein